MLFYHNSDKVISSLEDRIIFCSLTIEETMQYIDLNPGSSSIVLETTRSLYLAKEMYVHACAKHIFGSDFLYSMLDKSVGEYANEDIDRFIAELESYSELEEIIRSSVYYGADFVFADSSDKLVGMFTTLLEANDKGIFVETASGIEFQGGMVVRILIKWDGTTEVWCSSPIRPSVMTVGMAEGLREKFEEFTLKNIVGYKFFIEQMSF